MYVCICMVAMWCSVCVLGSQGLSSWVQAPLRQFSIWFFHLPPTSPTSPPSCDWYLAFARVQIQGLFSCNSNGPGGTSGAHTTCCEERPFSCEFLVWLQELCLHGSQCRLVHRHPGSARCAWPPSGSKRIYIYIYICWYVCVWACWCVCVCVSYMIYVSYILLFVHSW